MNTTHWVSASLITLLLVACGGEEEDKDAGDRENPLSTERGDVTNEPAPSQAPDDSPSSPSCKSKRSVCDYFQATGREQCSDCQLTCIELLKENCNPYRSCAASCDSYDCDDDERSRCSDHLED